MPISVIVIDKFEFDDQLKYFGSLRDEDWSILVKKCRRKKMKCLRFIPLAGNIIFNRRQVDEIKKEIHELKNKSTLRGEVLDLIESAANYVKRKNTYLKFEGE